MITIYITETTTGLLGRRPMNIDRGAVFKRLWRALSYAQMVYSLSTLTGRPMLILTSCVETDLIVSIS